MHFMWDLEYEKSLDLFLFSSLSWPTSVTKYLDVNISVNKFDELLMLKENFANTMLTFYSRL